VPLKDHEWFGSLGANGAFGSHEFTSETETLNLQQWSAKWVDLKNPLVCTYVQTLADYKYDLETLCTDEPGVCSEQVQAKVTALYNKITAAHATAKQITNK